jgi:phage shock protein A
MKWIDRILAALRTAARDLISEEDIAEEEDRVSALLAAAQTRLNVLRDELAKAIAREKQAEAEWQDALAQANLLDGSVDAALRHGQDDTARTQIAAASRAQIKADELGERYQGCTRVTARLREEVKALQTQIDEARFRQTHLADREISAEALEQLNRLRRDQRQDARRLRSDLDERKEQLARREDKLAARDEIERDKP